jgi:hypothetical protein
MVVVTNAKHIFNEIPKGKLRYVLELRYIADCCESGYPELGKTTSTDASEKIDLDTVPLNGGFLVKTLVLSSDPYLRGRMRDVSIQSYAVSCLRTHLCRWILNRHSACVRCWPTVRIMAIV